jgi:hypothetical protein
MDENERKVHCMNIVKGILKSIKNVDKVIA